MSLLANAQTATDVADDTDSVGSSGPWDSGLYEFTVNMAFVGESKGGANFVTLHLGDASGRELRQTMYYTSGRAKGTKTFYETQDGQKKNLPGFTLFRSLCLMTLNKEPAAINTEEKVIKLYDFDAKAEVPTTVPVIVDLLGQKIIAGVLRQTVDKNVKDANGNYVPSGDTRDENEIDKFFHAGTRLTLAEATGGKTAGEFIDTWEAKFKGQVKMKATGAKAGGAPNAAPSAFGQAAATPKPTTSIFGS